MIIHGEEYLTATEASEYLGVSPTTFIRYQHEYKLQAISRKGMGHKKFYKKSDLEPLLEWHIVDGHDGHKAPPPS